MISRRTLNRMVLAGLLQPLATLPRRTEAATGNGSVSVLSDGNMVLPLDFLLPDTPIADVLALEGAAFAASGEVRPPCNPTLLRAGDRTVLFDAGAGPNFMPTTGLLPESLEAAGVMVEDITDVIFTHAHPDHIWGVLDDFDEVVFPGARFHIAGTEWDYWRAEATLAATPDARKSFVIGARNRFDAIEDRTERFSPGAEVLPGIEAVDTSGHTPGHASFVIHDLDEPVMLIGDALSNDPVSFARPDWHWGADHDPEAGAATRRRLLDRLAAEKMRLVGFHLPGGDGRVERSGPAYRFVPGA